MSDANDPSRAADDTEAPTADCTGPTRPALDVEAAQRLVPARYQIESHLGSGGMGSVFAARDTLLERRVAIKLLAGQAPSLESPRRLLREARAMAKIDHPNLCRVYEVIADGPVPVLIMEWIDGEHLGRYWALRPLEERLELLEGVARGVAAAHAGGLVHGDLKPSNILIDRRGEPVIVDFGLAAGRAAGSQTDGVRGGTPGYAAPEQFEPGAGVGPPADVFALGVLLYEAITGRRPFASGQLGQKMTESAPPLPETLAPEVPAALQRICLAALEPDPADRYADAEALRRDLDRFRRGESVVARPRVLLDRLTEQIEAQVSAARSWRRQGFVTAGEYDRLVRQLRALQRPESPWIVDSRRLSVSQVGLYLGGWLVLLALSVGLYFVWNDLAGPLRAGLPVLVAAILCGAGLLLHWHDQRRIALAWLVTACSVFPMGAWALLRELGWLASAGPGELFAGEAVPDPVSNRQMVVIASVWLGGAVLLRLATRASAFTLLAVVALVCLWVALWLDQGRLELPGRLAPAELGMWLALLGAALLAPAVAINRAEERLQRRLGPRQARRHDAWPILGASVALVLAGLSLAAWFRPEWYLYLEVADPLEPADVARRSGAFMINGLLLHGLSRLLMRSPTMLRRSVTTLLRWVVPSHFLGALVAMETEEVLQVPGLWLAVLWLAAAACCVLSALRQWKPFFVTGLVYLGIVCVRSFVRFDEWFEADLPQVLLGAAILCAGFGLLVGSARAPARTSEPGDAGAPADADPARRPGQGGDL